MWVKTKVKIPDHLKPDERNKLSDDIINFIQERTAAGYDKNDNKFVPYTKEYAAKKHTSRSNVDLVLSGDMMLGLKLLQSKKGELTIGFDRSSNLNGRAEGNIKGTYGNSVPVTKPRDFLGIDSAMVEILADQINDNVLTDAEVQNIDLDAEARRLAEEILGDIFD